MIEWAQTDAEWFWEAYRVLVAYQQGREAGQGIEQTRHDMQC